MTFLTLLLWGSLFLRFWAKGELGEYLHPSFHNLAIGTGLGLIGLAVAWYWATKLVRVAGRSCCCAHEGSEKKSNTPSHKGARSAAACFLLMVSFAGALALSTGECNEVHLVNRQLITTAVQAPTLNEPGRVDRLKEWLSVKNNHNEIGVDLLLLAGEKSEWRGALYQKEVNVIGQVRTSGLQQHIVRLLSNCCAADARPIGVGVSSEAVGAFSTGDWVKARGRVEFIDEGGSFSTRLTQAQLTKSDAPKNVMLY